MIAFPPPDDDALILGAGGLLGQELVRACHRAGRPIHTCANAAAVDITNPKAVRRVVRDVRPSIVLNAAGYTNVDHAECDFETALAVNGDGPGNIAAACAEVGALLVHFSSDYVFHGSTAQPYTSDAAPDPINSYGLSKLAGEKAVIGSGCEYVIIRTSALFAPRGCNFLTRILRLAAERDTIDVISDQCTRPTACADLAAMTLTLLERSVLPERRTHTGRILHMANSGHATWYDFARQIVARAQLPCEVRPCTSEACLLHAPRPAYSVLDISETAALIGEPRHWREAMRDCLQVVGAIPTTTILRAASIAGELYHS